MRFKRGYPLPIAPFGGFIMNVFVCLLFFSSFINCIKALYSDGSVHVMGRMLYSSFLMRFILSVEKYIMHIFGIIADYFCIFLASESFRHISPIPEKWFMTY